MGVEGKRFLKTGSAIQVAGLKASGSKKVTDDVQLIFDANNDRIVEIYNASASEIFFKLKVSDGDIGTKPTSIQDGVCIVFPQSVSRPFLLPAGCKIKSNGDLLIVPLDKEDG